MFSVNDIFEEDAKQIQVEDLLNTKITYKSKAMDIETDLQDWTLTSRNVRTSSSISPDKFKTFFTANLHSTGTYSYYSQEYDFGIHQYTVSAEAGN